MTIIYQLLWLYLSICMRIQRFIFVMTVKVSTFVIHSAVRAFTEKFCLSINRFFPVALCFLLFMLIFNSYFALFMRLCFSAQECPHLTGKILLDAGSSEIGTFTNTVPITVELAPIGFLPIGNPFLIKDVV